MERVEVGSEIAWNLPVGSFTSDPDSSTSVTSKPKTFKVKSVAALDRKGGISKIYNRRVVKEGPLADIGIREYIVFYCDVEAEDGTRDFLIQFIGNEWDKDEYNLVFLRDAGAYKVSYGEDATPLTADQLHTVKEEVVDYLTECLYGSSNPEGWSHYYFNSIKVKHPVDDVENNLRDTIIDLNDGHKWKREKIAQWIASLDNSPKIERFPGSWILTTLPA